MRAIILSLWFLLTITVAFEAHAVYHYAVTNFMNPSALYLCTWTLGVTMVTGVILVTTTAFIFAYKIYKLGGGMLPLVFIIPPQLVGVVGAFAIGVIILKMPAFLEFEAHFAWVWYAYFGTQAFSDCALSTVLCIMLAKRRTGFKRSDSLIQTIIQYSINTCLLTSAVSIASNATMPFNFIHIAIAQVLPPLMFNSLLALLNSRDVMRNIHCGQVISIHLSRLRGSSRLPGAAGAGMASSVDDTDIEDQRVVDISADAPKDAAITIKQSGQENKEV
ncbi:hypothetical protein PsYK624_101850 [Phanerochaete sordida]|uniref:DUF6534 domain-containing protein n=1 Tax=Phanerochaete sordida TaxID=48140 RepID=A0A9P3LHD5_9APHY|nr:hypothetical protein PsYK624_101850 [Phanerochaete sordida]